MSCCEQACVIEEFRPHLMVNGVQCGMDERMNLPGGQWTPWRWRPTLHRVKPVTVYMDGVAIREYRLAT